MKKIIKIVSAIFTLCLLGAIIFAAIIVSLNNQFESPGPLSEPTIFTVRAGDTFISIVPSLEQANIIAKQGILRPFIYGVKNAGQQQNLKTGEFEFTPNMSMKEVMEKLTTGKPIEYAITIPEGWTSHQIIERLNNVDFLSGELVTGEPVSQIKEGSILANTYNFQRGTKRTTAINRMQEAQKQVVEKLWQTRQENLPLSTKEEFVILASIVEKETGIASERAKVASVFINRLNKGMKLQTDPTIIYGIWGSKGKPKNRGGIRQSELAKATPYNTYIIEGLPPTPIAHVGMQSLQAVANPDETDYLYFVADGTGGHVFAKTLQQHNINVAKWRKIEQEQKQEQENDQ